MSLLVTAARASAIAESNSAYVRAEECAKKLFDVRPTVLNWGKEDVAKVLIC
jgi:hypothetical protein